MEKLVIRYEQDWTPEYVELATKLHDFEGRVKDLSTDVTELERDLDQYLDDLAQKLPKVDWQERSSIVGSIQNTIYRFHDRKPDTPVDGKFNHEHRSWEFSSEDRYKELFAEEVSPDKLEEIIEAVKAIIENEQ